MLSGWGLFKESTQFSKIIYETFSNKKVPISAIRKASYFSMENNSIINTSFTTKTMELERKSPTMTPIGQEIDLTPDNRFGRYVGKMEASPRNKILKCSVCEQNVKGFRIFCNNCNHGGHPKHLIAWFSEHNQCPTGCGCNCEKYTQF